MAVNLDGNPILTGTRSTEFNVMSYVVHRIVKESFMSASQLVPFIAVAVVGIIVVVLILAKGSPPKK